MIKIVSIKNKGDIKKMLPKLKEKLLKKGIKIKNSIGEGHFGIVFPIDNKTVLKITSDESEAKTSSKFVGKNFKNINKIFKVFKFTSIPDIYFIVQERLSPLTSEEHYILSDIDDFLPTTKDIPKMLNILKEYKKAGSIEQYFEGKGLDENSISYITEIFENELGGIEYITKNPLSTAFFLYELKNLIDLDDLGLYFNSGVIEAALKGIYEMYKKGIIYSDTHAGNVLRNSKGILKWIDLGYKSDAKGKENIEIVKAIRKLLKRI